MYGGNNRMSGKKTRGLEKLKERYGLLFVTPWLVSMLLFFVYPIAYSVYSSFGNVTIDAGGVTTGFKGLDNYKEILLKDPKYLDNVFGSFKDIFVSLPFIIVVSIVLALLLNRRFKGRIFFRGMFFMSVIFASGPVLNMFLKTASGDATSVAVAATPTFDLIDFASVLEGLNLPESVEKYVSAALGNIFMLVWQSGIQTVLLIAGLQSIPELHYEVARVEGATSWETFWFVTLPQLMRTLMLAIIFTVVELCSLGTNDIISNSYSKFNNMEYGLGSAMLWFYYVFILIFIGFVFLIYKKVFERKWG